MQINAMIFFDAPFRGWHVIPLLGVVQTTSLLVVLICGSDEEGNLTSLKEDDLIAYTMLFYEPQEFTKEEIEETAVIEFYTFE